MFIKRTDLALEARELWQESAERTTRLMGVKATKSKLEGYPVTRVDILDHRGEEALDMIQSMNTGHDGSLSTGPANSPRDMLSRLETMILMAMELPLSAIRRQIASAVDILIHLGRMRDRSRKVMEIVEITGYDRASGEITERTLFQLEETKEQPMGVLVRKQELLHVEKLNRAGIVLEKM